MGKYILLLSYWFIVQQSVTSLVLSDTKFSELEQKKFNAYLLMKEEMEALKTKMAEEMTKFTEQFYSKIEDQNKKIFKMNIEFLKHHPENFSPEDTKTASVPQPPNYNSLPTGTTFIRWGRQDCPSNISVPVYIGTVGGSYYTHKGGAAEYVCMPPDPQWDVNKHYNSPYWGYMYGGKYQANPDQSLLKRNIPCTVCLSTAFSTKIMIPGRNTCYAGWQKAYHGELASGYYNAASPTEYICLDKESIGLGTKKTTEYGKLVYPVRVKCGALPCPPYENDRLLTCIVCLK